MFDLRRHELFRWRLWSKRQKQNGTIRRNQAVPIDEFDLFCKEKFLSILGNSKLIFDDLQLSFA